MQKERKGNKQQLNMGYFCVFSTILLAPGQFRSEKKDNTAVNRKLKKQKPINSSS